MRKIIELYLNYKLININKKSFEEYYIINQNWINEYKKYYDYNSIYDAIEKKSYKTNVNEEL